MCSASTIFYLSIWKIGKLFESFNEGYRSNRRYAMSFCPFKMGNIGFFCKTKLPNIKAVGCMFLSSNITHEIIFFTESQIFEL